MRPRKRVAELKRTGQYRADRHGNRCDDRVATGAPRKPSWLQGDAAWLWTRVVNSLAKGVLAGVDTAMLASACRWWALWRQFDQQLAAGEGNPYKITTLAAMAWKHFSTAASKLGLSPADRTKLHLPPEDDGIEPVAKRDRRTSGDPMVQLLHRRREHFAGN
ncbi:MAG: P27 family phage terminase small subunit [Planctomycetota bacterium]|jgi:P27 family predicted phage terminase small subunit